MSAAPLRLVTAPQAEERTCIACNTVKPMTEEFYRPNPPYLGRPAGFRKKCRECCKNENESRDKKHRENSQQAKAVLAKRWQGTGGGGYSERLNVGTRFVAIPDSHGHRIDPQAAAAALAGVSYFKPALIVMLGDHVDLGAVSRHPKSPHEQGSLLDDIEAAKAFLKDVRRYAPDADILYLQGNHEARMQRYLWSNAAALWKLQGLEVPRLLELGEHRIAYEESGTRMLTPHFLAKHGNFVRSKAGMSGMAEMERNGVSGMSGHTHRGGVVRKRSKLGVTKWGEGGCLCDLNPSYAEGQTADWAHGFLYGCLLDDPRGAHMEFAEIHAGVAWMGDREVSG